MLKFLFHALTERLKALFITHTALEFEAELVSRDAERRAELIRQASQYDREGLHDLAEQLRQQAEALSLERPLASVLPALDHWQQFSSVTANGSEPAPELLPLVKNAGPPESNPRSSRPRRPKTR